MSAVQSVIENASAALGWAVLHSLWQCTVIGVLAALLQIPARRASVRYGVWTFAVFACFGWFVWTLAGGLLPAGGEGGPGFSGGLIAPRGGGLQLVEVIAWLWAGGFFYFALRFAFQWLGARRLRSSGIVAVDAMWEELFAGVRERIGVSRRVRMLVSEIAESPMVVGWVDPVVIVPLGVLSSLSPDQVRLVLVHELAHIRRFDHLVNALQVLIETVLFYHPLVWWMSRQARLEREHCCDDAAVRWGGDAVLFARALTELETVRTNTRAVLALHQGDSLMERITRILGNSSRGKVSRGTLRTAAVLVAGTMVAAAGIANAARSVEAPSDEQITLIRSNVDSGVMTRAQARSLFDRLIYPGSDVQMKVDEHLEHVRLDIEAAVESGRITAEEGHAKLEAFSAGMDDRVTYHFMMAVLGMNKAQARLTLTRDRLSAMIAAGELTQEQADERLAALERELGDEAKQQDHLAEIKAKIAAAVEAGEITPEEGRMKIEMVMRRIELGRLQAEMIMQVEQAVESGEITREQAEIKLQEIKQKLDAERAALKQAAQAHAEHEHAKGGQAAEKKHRAHED